MLPTSTFNQSRQSGLFVDSVAKLVGLIATIDQFFVVEKSVVIVMSKVTAFLTVVPSGSQN